MVSWVRRGYSIREVARQFKVSQPTVQRWVERAIGKRLDRVNFADHSSAPHQVVNRTSRKLEGRVLELRKYLREESPLGEFGAQSIHREMELRGETSIPSRRTIGYILERHGALDYRRRLRRVPPPKGWHLPDLAEALAEMDEFDFVAGLLIRGGTEVEVLNGVSLHGGIVGAFPNHPYDTKAAMAAIIKHWRQWGLPDYAQFDNDTRFQGPHQHKDTIGRIIKMCLSLQVTPVFAVPREHGLQNAIESFNNHWQEKVWHRYEHQSLEGLLQQSQHYIEAKTLRRRARIDGAPSRREFPANWEFQEQKKVKGRIIYVRRTNDKGEALVLGNAFAVDHTWCHRLVKCTVDIEARKICFYALRRSDHKRQPLLKETDYKLPLRYIED